MKAMAWGLATVLLGTASYVVIGIALASVG